MKFEKINGNVKITMLDINLILGLLKLKTKKTVEVAMPGETELIELPTIIDDLDALWDDKLNNGVLSISISIGEFKRFEELILLLPKFKEKIIREVEVLDYYNNIFILEYLPYANGGSNKLYYFEDNNTFMFFDENGPNLKTESKTSTFLDIVGK